MVVEVSVAMAVRTKFSQFFFDGVLLSQKHMEFCKPVYYWSGRMQGRLNSAVPAAAASSSGREAVWDRRGKKQGFDATWWLRLLSDAAISQSLGTEVHVDFE